MASKTTGDPRPLSPHLQVYRPQITTVMSILHRITGVGLGVGTLLLAWWLIAAASGPAAYATAQAFLGSIVGLVLLFGFTLALCYHLFNGVRHLWWDSGRGFDLESVTASGAAVFAGAGALTLAIWLLALTAG